MSGWLSTVLLQSAIHLITYACMLALTTCVLLGSRIWLKAHVPLSALPSLTILNTSTSIATHPHAQTVSVYHGQNETIAMPESVIDSNLQAIFTEVHGFAKALGCVRSLAYVETKGFKALRLRAESWRVGQTPSCRESRFAVLPACFSGAVQKPHSAIQSKALYIRYGHRQECCLSLCTRVLFLSPSIRFWIVSFRIDLLEQICY